MHNTIQKNTISIQIIPIHLSQSSKSCLKYYQKCVVSIHGNFINFTHESMVGFSTSRFHIPQPTLSTVTCSTEYRIYFSLPKIKSIAYEAKASIQGSRNQGKFSDIHLYIYTYLQSRNLKTYCLQEQATQASLIHSLKQCAAMLALQQSFSCDCVEGNAQGSQLSNLFLCTFSLKTDKSLIHTHDT